MPPLIPLISLTPVGGENVCWPRTAATVLLMFGTVRHAAARHPMTHEKSRSGSMSRTAAFRRQQAAPVKGIRAVQVIDLDVLPTAGPQSHFRSSSSCTLGRTYAHENGRGRDRYRDRGRYRFRTPIAIPIPMPISTSDECRIYFRSSVPQGIRGISAISGGFHAERPSCTVRPSKGHEPFSESQ